jgi:hypothetical protein
MDGEQELQRSQSRSARVATLGRRKKQKEGQQDERTGFEGRAGDGDFCQAALVVVYLQQQQREDGQGAMLGRRSAPSGGLAGFRLCLAQGGDWPSGSDLVVAGAQLWLTQHDHCSSPA